MSDTTEVLLTHDILEPPGVVERLRSPFAGAHGLQSLDQPGVQPLWAAAYARLDLTDLIGHLSSIGWQYPENVQVLIKKEHDQRYQLWTYAGPSLTQLVDGNPDS
jgi:hypothetical protein